MITDSTQIPVSLGQVTIGDSTAPSYSFGTVNKTPGYVISTTTGTWNPNTWSATDMFVESQSGKSGKLVLQGENADIEINGKSLLDTLRCIEERINILTVNAELESEWEELRELGNQYRALEQRIKDKIKVWNKLQTQDKNNR